MDWLSHTPPLQVPQAPQETCPGSLQSLGPELRHVQMLSTQAHRPSQAPQSQGSRFAPVQVERGGEGGSTGLGCTGDGLGGGGEGGGGCTGGGVAGLGRGGEGLSTKPGGLGGGGDGEGGAGAGGGPSLGGGER